MGYVSVIAACLSWVIASDVFVWPYRAPVDALARSIFDLRGHAAAFVAVPLLWSTIGLILVSVITGARAVLSRSAQRWVGAAGLLLTATLIVVGAFEFVALRAARARNESMNARELLHSR